MTRKITKGGFTLIELLVVLAIIGILMGIMGPKIGRMMGNAREHKCRNNLKQLHTAVMNYVMDDRNSESKYPAAMSYEVFNFPGVKYEERRGWVSWKPETGTLDTKWEKQGNDPTAKAPEMIQGYGFGDVEKFCVENGTLFEYLNRDYEQYVCPVTRKLFNTDEKLYRTYAMNVFFHSPENPAYDRQDRERGRIGNKANWQNSFRGNGAITPTPPDDDYPNRNRTIYNYTPEASKLLLFCETEPNPSKPEGKKHEGGEGKDAKESLQDAAIARSPHDCCFSPPLKSVRFQNDEKDGDYIFASHRGLSPDERTSLAVFLDGHIDTLIGEPGKITRTLSEVSSGNEKIYAAVNGRKENIGWFLVRGLDPESDVPTGITK